MSALSPRHLLLALAFLGACSDGSGPDVLRNATDVACEASRPLDLAPGQDTVVDLRADGGCVSLAAASAEREYIVAAYAGSGIVLPGGVRADAVLTSGAALGVAAREAPEPPFPSSSADRLHAALRRSEQALAPRARAEHLARRRTAPRAAPPALGSTRTFRACGDLDCASTVELRATARYVGRSVAIFVDSLTPAGGYTEADLAEVGALFDDYLLPIDTTAFGAVSDIDGNGVVIALLTPALNALSGPGCSNGIVLGYFAGRDLVPSQPGSNAGEVFLSLVPDPASTSCRITREFALAQLPVTFVHELQHMISYHQHVLLRGGAPESTWLNEGLSHLAEEFAGRQIPDAPGRPPRSRFTQFALNNVDNAYEYLLQPERFYLVFPGISTGAAGERGAAWLFTRWLVDQYTDARGEARVTRRLLETTATGFTNVEALAGLPFDRLVGTWLLAAWADDLGVPGASPRLGLSSWNLRETYRNLNSQDPGLYPRPFPIAPPLAGAEEYARTVALRGGSGTYVRVVVPPGSRPARLRAVDGTGALLRELAAPRAAVLRTR